MEMEDGDLEDGELLSSDEEVSDSKQGVSEDKPGPHSNSTTLNDKRHPPPAVDPVSDGEVSSDNEESAFYPNRIKSRSKTPPRKPTSRWSSDYQHSPRATSPDRRRKRIRSPSSEREGNRDNREDSDDSPRSHRMSRDRRRGTPPPRSADRSPPDNKHHYSGRRDRDSPGPPRNKFPRRTGGYGGQANSSYQPPGGRFGRRPRPLKRHTNYSERDIRLLAQDVPKRKEDGLSLLPDPGHAKNSRVDLSIYPPPPTWYLRELKAWDEMHKAKKISEAQKPAETPIPVPNTPSLIPIPGGEGDVIPGSDSNSVNPDSNVTTDSEQVATEQLNPLTAGMPFAEPLPGSSRPLMEQPQPTPSYAMPTNITSIDTSDDNQVAKSDSTNNLAVSTLDSREELTQDDSSSNTCDEGFAPFERSLSLSSEVAMEIDLKRSNSETLTPDGTDNAFQMPTFTTEEAPPTTANPLPVMVPPTLPTIPEIPTTEENQSSHLAHVTASDPPQVHVTVSDPPQAPVTSCDPPPGHVTPCDPPEDPKGAPYKLRSQTDSKSKTVEAKPVKRPEIMDISDDEVDYDTYLDQLDDEEVSHAPALISSLSGLLASEEQGAQEDPFGEDFPVIDKGSKREESLMSLVGGDHKPHNTSGTGLKSTRRIEKELTWKAKQKQRNMAAARDVEKLPVARAPCKYFMNGTCKNGDNCSFSHDCPRVRKKEVCKFYVQGTCSKGDDCMYYHGDFPCKFYHLRQYCRNGNTCKFSHAPLTPETEVLLATVADSLTSPVSTPTSLDERLQISDTGVSVHMFGSQPPVPSTSDHEEIIVSFPLTKVSVKGRLKRIPKKHKSSVTSSNELTKEQDENPPRKVLLPTPPPHMKLTEDDFKRFESMSHEYWEAPEISQAQVGQRYEQSFRPPHPHPPRPRQPFNPPPRPPPGQNWQRPPQWGQHGPPQDPGHWNRAKLESNYGYEQRPNRMEPGHSGMEIRQDQRYDDRANPRHNSIEQYGGVEQRPQYGPDHRPQYGPDDRPQYGPDHKPQYGPDQRYDRVEARPEPRLDPKYSEQRHAGMEQRHAGMEHNSGPARYRSMEARSDPRYIEPRPGDYRHDTGRGRVESRFPSNDPRFPGQGDPRGAQGQAQKSNNPSPQYSPPYSGELGMSPPGNTRPWAEKISPHWGSSPDHSSAAKGLVDPTRRVDPRKKYSHLKIKAKNSPSSLKSDSTEGSESGFKIPKLLEDSNALDKPIKPSELFGGEVMDTQPYGEITFNTYKPFTQKSDTTDSPQDTTTSTDNSSQAVGSSAQDKSKTVPSYFTQIDSELGGGLEIESAFGTLSKGKDNEKSEARKLPSVFGYGL